MLLLAAGAPAACGTASESPSAATTPGSVGVEPVSENLASDSPAVDGGSLVVGVAAETAGWNPHVNQWATWSAIVGSAILEPLAVLDEEGVAQPWLATTFTSNATADEWTLELRDDVSFQNGEKFDAAAVKRNIDDLSTAPLTSVPLDGMFERTEILGPSSLKVVLARPWAVFPSAYLAGQTAFMMAPKMLDAPDGGQDHPIGTGPFTFDRWTRDQSLAASKNTTYWREGEPHLDSIEFRVIPDTTSQANALRAGDVDMIFASTTEAPDQLADGFQMVKNWSTEPSMLITNTVPEVKGEKNPLENLHARRALAMATDRETLAREFGQGVLSPTSPFAPDNVWGQPADQNGYPDFDVEKAKAEVEQFKRDTGADELRVTMTGPAAQSELLLQTLQSQWLAAGIESSVETVEASALISRVIVGDFQLVYFPIYTVPDPDQNLFFWTSANAKGAGNLSINFAQFASDTVDEQLAIGRESADPPTRKAAYSALVKELNENAVNIWLYWTPYTLIADQRVRGLQAASVIPFANHEPKTFYGQLWVAS